MIVSRRATVQYVPPLPKPSYFFCVPLVFFSSPSLSPPKSSRGSRADSLHATRLPPNINLYRLLSRVTQPFSRTTEPVGMLLTLVFAAFQTLRNPCTHQVRFDLSKIADINLSSKGVKVLPLLDRLRQKTSQSAQSVCLHHSYSLPITPNPPTHPPVAYH